MAIYIPSQTIEIPGLDRIPILKYLKEPAIYKEELYARYPSGGEYGWFAFVYSLKSFVYWDPDTQEWALLNLGSENVNLIRYMQIDQELYAMGPADIQTIKCTIYDGYNRAITSQYGQLDVKRDSGDYYSDQLWDQVHGMNKGFEFTITFDDLNFREGSTGTMFTLIATRDASSIMSYIKIR
jgi:hypothetical protein